MGWSEWPKWLKGGIILAVIYVLLMIVAALTGTSTKELFTFYTIKQFIFLIVLGFLFGLIIEREWPAWIRIFLIGFIISIPTFLLTLGFCALGATVCSVIPRSILLLYFILYIVCLIPSTILFWLINKT